MEDTLSDGTLSVSNWSRPDDEVRDTVRLRTGPGVVGTKFGIPEVTSVELGVDGFEKQVRRRPSKRLATRCICKHNKNNMVRKRCTIVFEIKVLLERSFLTHVTTGNSFDYTSKCLAKYLRILQLSPSTDEIGKGEIGLKENRGAEQAKYGLGQSSFNPIPPPQKK